MGGATSGNFAVKLCGKAHAWCAVCRPAQATAQQKPRRMPKTYLLPCRNCGRCDACVGLTAPEGMKVCRQCGETKDVSAFATRADTGGRRNQCISCRNKTLKSIRCTGCNRWFVRNGEVRTLCPRCRPPLTKPCLTCGVQFVGSMDQRRYCSPACGELAVSKQRVAARRDGRMRALQAYGGVVPQCSCCGEGTVQFLALDHVNGGGHTQRKELGGGGFYVWLRKNNYPEGFRVLCHNCNIGRQINGGLCPHKEAT